ncbi:uncharacterized protein LOC124282625 [Haliotis rubra]|uniref:uncharacterized protein LOC124282625 n=1 Tax=Haliotis rubra TaxID=36100 RepID=UPI001EE5C7A4|nr:uncharacterized protein LOC124282625 [Haliotis rubra]
MAHNEGQGAKGQRAPDTDNIFDFVENLREVTTNPRDTTSTGGKSNPTEGFRSGTEGVKKKTSVRGPDPEGEKQPPIDAILRSLLASQPAQSHTMAQIGTALAKLSNSTENTDKDREYASDGSIHHKHGGAHETEEGEASDEDEMDELIHRCLDQGKEKDNHDETDDFNSLMEDMVDFFGEEDATGPEINSDLAKSINDGLTKSPNMDKLKPVMEKYKRPKNLDYLMAPRVNSVIWLEARAMTRSKDINLQRIQSLLDKATIPVVQMMDSLMSSVVHKKELNAKELLGKTKDAVRMLVGLHSDINTTRRETFKPDFRGPYKRLCSGETVATTNLFGDDLPKNIKDITESKELSNKLHSSDKTNRGFTASSFSRGARYGHGHDGSRFRPYDSQYKGYKRGGFAKGRGQSGQAGTYGSTSRQNQAPFLGKRPTGSPWKKGDHRKQ